MVVSFNPTLTTSNESRDEVVAIFSLSMKLRADAKAVFLLVKAQEPGHSVVTMRIMLTQCDGIL
jgi:hypothetical protein